MCRCACNYGGPIALHLHGVWALFLLTRRCAVISDSQVLIYVFDIESRELAKDMEYYASCLQAVRQNSKSAKVFCLVHKMDLIPEEQREEVFNQRERELLRLADHLGLEVACFNTSIWDETL